MTRILVVVAVLVAALLLFATLPTIAVVGLSAVGVCAFLALVGRAVAARAQNQAGATKAQVAELQRALDDAYKSVLSPTTPTDGHAPTLERRH